MKGLKICTYNIMLLSEITGGIAFFESVLDSVMRDDPVDYDDSDDVFDGGDESDVFEFGGHEEDESDSEVLEEVPDEVFSVDEESDGELFESANEASIDDIAELLRKMIKNYVSKH